ncbi:MAG TPA: hypothetical protein VJI96_01810 [Candidatus Andersenbacteria bacterium]|nr:hypothetical protein [Candidatus Andersenbacteria bacterium]
MELIDFIGLLVGGWILVFDALLSTRHLSWNMHMVRILALLVGVLTFGTISIISHGIIDRLMTICFLILAAISVRQFRQAYPKQ